MAYLHSRQTSRSPVAIDRQRMQSIMHKLKDGGLYEDCHCDSTGCRCATGVRRLLQRAVERGQYAGLYRPDRTGDRYRVYRYPLQGRWLSVMADQRDRPTVVDVGFTTGDLGGHAADGSMQVSDEVGLGALMATKASHGYKGKLRDFKPAGNPTFTKVASPSAAGAGKGLYLLQWDGGQYFGKADNLQRRLTQHQASMKRYGVDPEKYAIYIASASDPRSAEHAILKGLLKIAGGSLANFARLGLTNQQTELEFGLY